MVSTDAGAVVIFSGRYGSGKTEIALNFAAALASPHSRPAFVAALVAGRSVRPILVDLDLVTPYFRSRQRILAMAAHAVDVIAPPPLTEAVDVPAVIPEILGAIQQRERPVVVDAGGDPQGARALGGYAAALSTRGYLMWFVVNPFRPFTCTPDEIGRSIREIERSSRLKVGGLVSNPNLMAATDAGVLSGGDAVVREAARRLGLPVVFTAVAAEFAPPAGSPAFPGPALVLERYFRLPWEQLSANGERTGPSGSTSGIMEHDAYGGEDARQKADS